MIRMKDILNEPLLSAITEAITTTSTQTHVYTLSQT